MIPIKFLPLCKSRPWQLVSRKWRINEAIVLTAVLIDDIPNYKTRSQMFRSIQRFEIWLIWKFLHVQNDFIKIDRKSDIKSRSQLAVAAQLAFMSENAPLKKKKTDLFSHLILILGLLVLFVWRNNSGGGFGGQGPALWSCEQSPANQWFQTMDSRAQCVRV